MRNAAFFLLLITLLSCSAWAQTSGIEDWSLLRSMAREPNHFTQGLVYADSQLFESTGRYGQSAVIAYHATTLREQKRQPLPADIFGEGLTFLHGKLYQSSWTSEKIFVYNTALQLQHILPMQGDGWGLTTDGQSLILSNGSNTLQFLDPTTGTVQRTMRVSAGNTSWSAINELEWIDGYILANIWHSNTVLLINGNNGFVEKQYDFSKLSAIAHSRMPVIDSEDVLNGLAWNPVTQTLLVTGKNWPIWFDIRISLPKQSIR